MSIFTRSWSATGERCHGVRRVGLGCEVLELSPKPPRKSFWRSSRCATEPWPRRSNLLPRRTCSHTYLGKYALDLSPRSWPCGSTSSSFVTAPRVETRLAMSTWSCIHGRMTGERQPRLHTSKGCGHDHGKAVPRFSVAGPSSIHYRTYDRKITCGVKEHSPPEVST